ncbi:MAG: FHA domain-containing protein [Oscillochloris sp.]|nr:FHA domain-containing protein [Oscillochloris sp.]
MPFCPQCGVANPDSARFCDQCGATLIPVPAQPAQAAPQTAAAPTHAGATASAGPGTCPQCGTTVIPGEAFCDNCGAALLGMPGTIPPTAAPNLPYSGVPPQPVYPPPQPVGQPPVQPPAAAPQPIVTPPIVTPPAPVVPVPPPTPVRSGLAPATLITPTGAQIALPAAAEALLGRADPVSNFFPDLDLTTHGALDNGVGRRHVRIFMQRGQVMVEDLDSTNGSFVNGARLAPRQARPLQNGDELRLGTLNLRVQL